MSSSDDQRNNNRRRPAARPSAQRTTSSRSRSSRPVNSTRNSASLDRRRPPQRSRQSSGAGSRNSSSFSRNSTSVSRGQTGRHAPVRDTKQASSSNRQAADVARSVLSTIGSALSRLGRFIISSRAATIVTAVIVLFIVVGIWDTASNWGKAYGNVSVAGIDVSGMNEQEIQDTLKEAIWPKVSETDVTVFSSADARDVSCYLRAHLDNLSSCETGTVLLTERHVLAAYHHCLVVSRIMHSFLIAVAGCHQQTDDCDDEGGVCCFRSHIKYYS